MLKIFHPPAYDLERAYIYDVIIGDIFGLKYRTEVYSEDIIHNNTIKISIEHDSGFSKTIVLNDSFFSALEADWLTSKSLPKQPLEQWVIPEEFARDIILTNNRLPIIYGEPISDLAYYAQSTNEITCGLDIFGSSFFMLTRYEEMVKAERDAHDRFPASASLAFQEGFLERPIVNEYIELLWYMLKSLWPELKRKLRAYEVCLSHDVDVPLWTIGKSIPRLLRSSMADIMRRRDPMLLARRLRASLEGRFESVDNDPNNTFSFIMDISEEHGWQSAFYFICKQDSDPDQTYDPEYNYWKNPWITKLMQEISQRGHEIGLHPSYGTYRDTEQTKLEFIRLRERATNLGIAQAEWGGRQHYLRWQNPITWQNWEDAGLDYDSTLGFAEQPGFRSGICYEYPVFNIKTRQALNLRERPLVVMECSVLRYMNLSFEESKQKILDLNSVCQQFSGDMTILWHNDHLISWQQKSIYRDICRRL